MQMWFRLLSIDKSAMHTATQLIRNSFYISHLIWEKSEEEFVVFAIRLEDHPKRWCTFIKFVQVAKEKGREMRWFIVISFAKSTTDNVSQNIVLPWFPLLILSSRRLKLLLVCDEFHFSSFSVINWTSFSLMTRGFKIIRKRSFYLLWVDIESDRLIEVNSTPFVTRLAACKPV